MARRQGWPTFFPGWDETARRPTPRTVAPAALPVPAPVILQGTTLPARGPAGVVESRDAILVASLLRRPLTLTTAEVLIDQLVPYRTRLSLKADINPLHGLVGQVPARLGEMTLRYVSPVLVDVLLPATRDYLLDRLVRGLAPEEDAVLPGVVEVADAMRRIVAVLKGAGRGILALTADACEREARTQTERLVRDTGPPTPDSMHRLARGLLRVEMLTFVLEALGSTAGLDHARFQSRRLARVALRRAGDALDAFVADRGLVTLHASLSVVAAVDGLIVIVLRILDSLQERPEERTAFVEPADRVDVARYVQAMGRLADTLLEMVGRAAVTPRLDDLFFEALIRQIGWMHRFCAHLGHEERPESLPVLQQRLAERTAKLAVFAGDALVGVAMRPAADRRTLATLLRRAESIAAVLRGMGQPEALEALAMRIVLVRDALGGRRTA